MAGHIVFENIPITNIIDDISIKSARDYNTSPYVGGTGSNTNFVSELGRVISFKNICPSYEELNDDGSVKSEPPITIFKNLSKEYKNKTGVLTSESHADLKGNYLCTDFEIEEDTGNNFTIKWEFTEVIPFNTVKQTFRVWGSAASSSSKQQKGAKTSTKTSGNKLTSAGKTLLKSCGTLEPSNKVQKCVKYLQKFLQSHGYYKKGKIDGKYGSTTKAEVKKLQKKFKLKQTGNWDLKTIQYFQKKYKIKNSITQKVVKQFKKDAKKLFKTR